MRIAFITPFSPDATMGRHAQLILPALLRRHQADVWCPQAPRLLQAPVPVMTFDSGLAAGDSRLDDYDMLVYQLGNNANHFARILDLARRRPGVLILADHSLHGLVSTYYLRDLRQPLVYVQLMERTYGISGRRDAEQAIIGGNSGMRKTGMLPDYPLFEPLLENAPGVVVHSCFHLDAVRRSYSGPATQINLAIPPQPPPAGLRRADLCIPEGRLLMLSTGYIASSKLHDVIIRALNRSPELASRVVFAIVGGDCPVESPKLRAMVQDFGLQESVRFVGYQPDEIMHAWIEHADFCVNLRRPNTEGASLSVLEQMRHGKAVVVLPTGFYAELPAGAVVRVAPDDLGNIHQLLLRLAADHAWRARVGAQAGEYTATGFDPAQYGERLGDFISDVGAARPLTSLRQRVSLELSRIGSTAEDLLGPHAEAEIRSLFLAGEPVPLPAGQPSQEDS